MADVKKAIAAAKPAAKPVAAAKEVKAEVKTEVKAPAVKKETVKKETVKKETVKKEAAKKAPAKKAEAKAPAKKAEAKAPAAKKAASAVVHVQFSGKEYKMEDFVNIAKDVWKYDLGKKAADFKSVELYVKPEENKAYYVINGEVTGNFDI